MKLKFKKLNENAVLPRKANPTDAGFDITATGYSGRDENGNMVYTTGLAVEIPEGYVGLIFPRSSISKYTLGLANSVGVIDAGYKGEILFKFKIQGPPNESFFRFKVYKPGDRIGQLIVMPLPQFEPEFVDELDNTNDRGGGFGSTNE